MVRLTVFLTCLFAALVEVKTVNKDEVWLAVVLNTVAGVTLLALIIFIGPLRLMRGAIKWYKTRRRANLVRGGQESTEKMSEEGESPGLRHLGKRRMTLTLHLTSQTQTK